MKKKLIIIIPLIIALSVFIGVYAYFHHEDGKTSLTVMERRWISNNSDKKYDFEIVNNLPVYAMDGAGVVFDFVKDLEIDTNLVFNKISYLKESKPATSGLKIRILNNEEALSNKDLLITEDGYVLLSKNNIRYEKVSDFTNMNVGIFNTDAGEISYYLKSAPKVTLKTYDTIEEILSALAEKEIDALLIPEMMYLEEIYENNFIVNYYFTEMNKKIVLTLTDDNNDLNNIIKKYYTKWKKDNYVSVYNEKYLKYYIEENRINDKTKADMLSKTYTYGYVENAPFETSVDGVTSGVAAEYIARLKRLTNIEIVYKKYKNIDELKSAISNKEIDIYFNYFDNTNNNYYSTISPFNEEYVVLRNYKKNSDNVTTFEELKGKNINMLSNTALVKYFESNSKANIVQKNNINDLIDKNLIIVDKETYNYHKNNKFNKYEVIYEDRINIDYNFGVLNNNTELYRLFNFIISTNSYENYRVSGLKSLNVSLIDKTTFEQLYLIVLGVILIPLLIFLALYIYLKNKKKRIKVKKEDRRKYTDTLTSLKNRNYLNLNTPIWEESKIYPQTIIIIDLNNIKYVNDNYGHEAGDNLIISAASTLVNTQLENSEIIRTDGNEFLIYLVGYTEKQIEIYCRKLTKEFKDLPYGFGAAIGYSMITDDIKTIEDATNEAIIEMKETKTDIQ